MMITQGEYGRRSGRAQGRRFSSGFSLVELMIVVFIMLLLAAIAMPRLLDAQKKAYEAGVVSFLRTLQTNQESYRMANGSYADNFTDLGLSALGPAFPGDPFAPDELPRLATLFPLVGPFRVYAAQSSQQPPPPPPQTGFGGDPSKQPPKKTSDPGKTGESGGIPAPTSGGNSNPASGSGSSGGSTSGSSGGSTSGGGTGGAGTGVPGAPQTGGGSGGSLSPSPAPTSKTNIVIKHNYIFTLQRPTPTTWTCTVAPVRDRGNSKFFYLDQTGVMRVELGKLAGSSSPQL